MNECLGCGLEQENSLCDTCKIMVPTILGSFGIMIEDGPEVDSLRQTLGNPEPKPAAIWRSMIRASDCDFQDHREILWARSDEPELDEKLWICSPPPPWDPSEDELEIFDSEGAGEHNPAAVRRASRGGILPDGSYLSWNEGQFFLDGKRIHLPYRGLLAILRKNRGGIHYDWRKLLQSIDIALRRLIAPRRPGMMGRPPNRDAVIEHPVFRLLIPRERRFPHHMNPNHEWQNSYKGASFADTTWMRRWEMEVGSSLLQPSFNETCSNVPTTLFLRKGRLQLRVRRPSGWRRISLANDPDLWTRVVTWALSPPNHSSFRSLLALQQHIFTDRAAGSRIGGENGRGLEFLRGVVNGYANATALPEIDSFRVKGTSGLEYFVNPGGGPHGSRFTVTPAIRGTQPAMNPRNLRHHGQALCIVETQQMRRLVIGDAIGGIILALLDDVGSRDNIDTLDAHLRSHRVGPDGNSPRGGNGEPHMNREFHRLLGDARHERQLRTMLENNDVAERVRRCTQSFPRLWSALLRLPLGERMTFTAMRGRGDSNISFDDCDTEFSTRSRSDRNVIYMMLSASGWIRDADEETLRGTRRIYIRTGLGQRDLGNRVQRFCEPLEDRLQLRQGDNEPIRLVGEPVYMNFERRNPGIADLLPDTDGPIR